MIQWNLLNVVIFRIKSLCLFQKKTIHWNLLNIVRLNKKRIIGYILNVVIFRIKSLHLRLF